MEKNYWFNISFQMQYFGNTIVIIMQNIFLKKNDNETKDTKEALI